MLKRFLQVAKLSWLIAVIAGGIWYVGDQYQMLIEDLRSIAIWRLFLSFGLITVGRLLITQLARSAVVQVGWNVSYRELFSVFWIAEPGKYMPGGIWHFVGRGGAYRLAGVSMRDAGRAIVIENLWLIISSSLFGCLLLIVFSDHSMKLLSIIALPTVWFALLLLIQRKQAMNANLPRLFLLQLTIWICIGASYFVLLSLDVNVYNFAHAVGVFSISWMIGVITPFAPGGIGTREAVLIGLMQAILPGNLAILYAGIHRLLWLVIEFVFALIAASLKTPVGSAGD